MRKVTLLLIALTVAGVAATAAPAATTTSTVTGAISPGTTGTTARPAAAKVTVDVVLSNDDGSQPAPVTTISVIYGKQIVVRTGALPKGTRVLTGSLDLLTGATATRVEVTGLEGGAGCEPGCVDLRLGAPLHRTTRAVVRRGKNKAGTLSFALPAAVVNPGGSAFASVTRFRATLAGAVRTGGRTVRYAETSGCPKGGIALSAKLVFATRAAFPGLPDGLVSSARSIAPAYALRCRAGQPNRADR
jgi:hypothetical protein